MFKFFDSYVALWIFLIMAVGIIAGWLFPETAVFVDNLKLILDSTTKSLLQ